MALCTTLTLWYIDIAVSATHILCMHGGIVYRYQTMKNMHYHQAEVKTTFALLIVSTHAVHTFITLWTNCHVVFENANEPKMFLSGCKEKLSIQFHSGVMGGEKRVGGYQSMEHTEALFDFVPLHLAHFLSTVENLSRKQKYVFWCFHQVPACFFARPVYDSTLFATG